MIRWREDDNKDVDDDQTGFVLEEYRRGIVMFGPSANKLRKRWHGADGAPRVRAGFQTFHFD